MQIRTRQSHMVDFLFPVALLFVFAVSSLAVILLATEVYRSTTENSSLNYTARTSMAYISEKIHQSDVGGDITLTDLNGCDTLILQQELNGTVYNTYIYMYENELKELFARDGLDFPAQMGKTILAVEDFSISEIRDGVFRFSCTDTNGQQASTIVSTRTGDRL